MSPLLETRHLCKAFGGLVAVKDVTMTVDEGEIFGIVGPNGAGKTTLFNLIAGTLRPSNGQLFLFGQRADRLPTHRRSWLGLGRTFQSAHLFSTHTVSSSLQTVRGASQRGLAGWLRMHRSPADLQAIAGLVELLELTDVAGALPSELTNLQQQKLAIGMALATDAQLLLLDEPSGGLIDTEVTQLLSFISGLRTKGKTVVVIDHKMRLMMKLCDRIMVMTAGEELMVGTPNEVAADAGVQTAYLGRKRAGATRSAEEVRNVG